MNIEKLLKAARQVKEKAYAPYSHFHVGAALLTPGGNIYTGCNVENTSYGLTICAERNAIFQMVAAGENRISEILVIGDSEDFLPPCGACRQVIAEFADKDTIIYMCNKNGEYREATVNDIIPYTFFLDR
ncbi:MAG TPA: cytidine deaminase [Candidatus Deferrimicrobium sp.]|nr:cytidine deaminase [Candidatus Deferrimicrobium sp.]